MYNASTSTLSSLSSFLSLCSVFVFVFVFAFVFAFAIAFAFEFVFIFVFVLVLVSRLNSLIRIGVQCTVTDHSRIWIENVTVGFWWACNFAQASEQNHFLKRTNRNSSVTMHRQQRLRSPSSSPSLQSLPRVSPARSSATNVLLSSASTSTSTPTPTLTPTPRSIASATSPTSSIALPTSSTWSTLKLSPFVWNVQQTSCSSLALLSNESSILTSSSAAALSSPPPPPPPPSSSSSSTISLPVPCPRLVSVLAWSMTLLLVTSCIGLTDAGILNGHPLGKRSFIDIQCKGIYDKSIFARLDRICEDCYNLFREPQLHQLCRKNCFTSDYFKGCLDVLLLQDEVEKIQTWIKQLHGAEPGV